MARHFAVAQHGDLVGEIHDLVQLVRDEDQAFAIVLHLTQRDEKIIDFGWRQDRRRLIEDEQLCIAVQRLEDLGPLAFANGKLPDTRIWVDVQAVPFRYFSEALLHGAHLGHSSFATEPERHVLGDGQGRHQHEMLVDHPDPLADRVGW